jgi:hypothetical protein
MEQVKVDAAILRLLAVTPGATGQRHRPAPLPADIARFIRRADRAELVGLYIETLIALSDRDSERRSGDGVGQRGR